VVLITIVKQRIANVIRSWRGILCSLSALVSSCCLLQQTIRPLSRFLQHQNLSYERDKRRFDHSRLLQTPTRTRRPSQTRKREWELQNKAQKWLESRYIYVKSCSYCSARQSGQCRLHALLHQTLRFDRKKNRSPTSTPPHTHPNSRSNSPTTDDHRRRRTARSRSCRHHAQRASSAWGSTRSRASGPCGSSRRSSWSALPCCSPGSLCSR